MNTPDIHIRKVFTKEERLAALKLRYEVFVEEYGDMRYAIPEEKLHRDAADNKHSCTLIAVDDMNTVVGTARFVPRRNGPYFGDDFYHYDVLANQICTTVDSVLARSGIISRAAVKREFRHAGVFRDMCSHLEGEAGADGIDYMVGAVDVSNSNALSIFQQLGYKVYGTWTNHDNWAGNYIYKVLD